MEIKHDARYQVSFVANVCSQGSQLYRFGRQPLPSTPLTDGDNKRLCELSTLIIITNDNLAYNNKETIAITTTTTTTTTAITTTTVVVVVVLSMLVPIWPFAF